MTATSSAPLVTPQDIYDALMAVRRGHPVEETLARILSSWSLGYGAMPIWLGLGEERFCGMLATHFPGLDPDWLPGFGLAVDPRRGEEMDDLHRLLMANRTRGSEIEALMADIVVAGCLGSDHLWQDLGLWRRADLSRLMQDNFATLAARNDRDMKWKKFLYKQLCETEGIYTCRAPSCEVCTDYGNCFGPEE